MQREEPKALDESKRQRRSSPSARLFREISESKRQCSSRLANGTSLKSALDESKRQRRSSPGARFNAGGTADFILIISVPGY